MMWYVKLSVLLILGLNAQAQVFIPFSFWTNASPLAISPTLIYLVPGDGTTFTATGGTGTYSWAISVAASNDGSTFVDNGSTMDYTARLTAYTTDVVSATSGANSVSASVVTYNSLTISPSPHTMVINTTQTFTGAGGCLNGTNCVGGARSYSLTSGSGTVVSSTGFYTAPATSGTAVVQVTDSIGNVATAIITIVSNLTIVPSTLNLSVYSTNTFTALAGSAPYTFSLVSGTGTVSSTSGLYTAPSSIGGAVVRVTDNLASTSDATITIIRPTDIAVGQYFACALHNNGAVKCWGTNNGGQLGIGSASTIGDATTEVGGANTFVDLGTGRTAVSISAGYTHVCALLDNSTVKCWGQNTYGQLGQGNTNSIGDNTNELGNNLASISLGSGRTATAVYAFGYVSCAKLDDGSMKCWGRNSSGQLGMGDKANRGDGSNEMGDNLTALDLGTGRTASKVSGGLDFMCALLDNGTVKCWGNGKFGQNGNDNTAVLGDGAGEMGDSLPVVNINGSGGSLTATDIASGDQFTCVKRSDNTEICWGRNIDGQCGFGDNNGQERNLGDDSGEMAALVAISMSTGFGTLSQIYTFGFSACAIDTLNVAKCWGQNTYGQLLYGNTTSRNAPIATVVNFGTGLVPSKISGGNQTLCALFTNDRIKCWGRATNASGVASGIFLIGTSTNALGDAAGEIGDSLNYVNH